MNHAMTLIEKSLREGFHILCALAVGFLMWGNFWEWWQALLFVAVLIVVPYIIKRWLLVTVFWMVAAPLLLIGTWISIFWVVSGPDTTIPVNITSKEQDVRTSQYGGSTTHYIIWAVDDHGRRYKVTVRRPQWESLLEGDKTSITYHYERVAGRWLPRRVKTKLGQESVVFGGGRFGTGMEVFNTLLDMGVSTLPLAGLVGLPLYNRRKIKRRQEVIEWVKMRMRHEVLGKPGISHTQLLRSVPGHSNPPNHYLSHQASDLKESAIKQLIEQSELKCEQKGRVRKYFAQ